MGDRKQPAMEVGSLLSKVKNELNHETGSLMLETVDKLCSTCQKRKPIESFVSGRATCTKCRGRKRTQYTSAKLQNGGPTKRTKAALEDGNTLTPGVSEKEMRMILQSNSELKATVATQQAQIQHLNDQLVLLSKQNDSLATQLSEALKVVAQGHSQLMLRGTPNNNQWGDSNAVPIPLHPQQQPNNSNIWHQRQDQSSRPASQGLLLPYPANAGAAQHASSISIVSGQTVYSGQTVHSEAADSSRQRVQAPAYISELGQPCQQPLMWQTVNPSIVSEDEQLLGWWQGATGYDTADTAARSVADPQQRCEKYGGSMLLPREGESNVQGLGADSTAPTCMREPYVQRFLPEPFKQPHMRAATHKRRGSDRSMNTEIRVWSQLPCPIQPGNGQI